MSLAAGLCPDPLVELTALPQTPVAGFGGMEQREEREGNG